LQLARETLHAVSIRDIELHDRDSPSALRGEIMKSRSCTRISRGRNYRVIVVGVLTCELQTEAAIGTRDQHCWTIRIIAGHEWRLRYTFIVPISVRIQMTGHMQAYGHSPGTRR
jgi:hypothetical protein